MLKSLEKLSFVRKYAPNIEDFISKVNIVSDVENAFNTVKTPRTVLITGVSGSGKTALGRLLALNHLGLKYSKNIDFSEVENLNEVDLICINNNTDLKAIVGGIGESTEIPKVYILDECQIYTTHAQLILADALASVPENVLVILCSTNRTLLTQELIKSCQVHVDILPPENKRLLSLLAGICEKECREFDTEGLKLIIKHCCNGSVRSAIHALEAVLESYGNATEDSVVNYIDSLSDEEV